MRSVPARSLAAQSMTFKIERSAACRIWSPIKAAKSKRSARPFVVERLSALCVVASGISQSGDRKDMSSENLHAPRERLSQKTLNLHFAIVSLMEELDAIDWYRQRADDAEEETLKELLLHNMREEMEHASMLLEWIRRH